MFSKGSANFRVDPRIIIHEHKDHSTRKFATRKIFRLSPPQVRQSTTTKRQAPHTMFRITTSQAPSLQRLNTSLIIAPHRRLRLSRHVINPHPRHFMARTHLLNTKLQPITNSQTINTNITRSMITRFTTFKIKHPFNRNPMSLASTTLTSRLIRPHRNLQNLNRRRHTTRQAISTIRRTRRRITKLNITTFSGNLCLIFRHTFTQQVKLRRVTTIFVSSRRVVIFMRSVFKDRRFSNVSGDNLCFGTAFLHHQQTTPPGPMSQAYSLQVETQA